MVPCSSPPLRSNTSIIPLAYGITDWLVEPIIRLLVTAIVLRSCFCLRHKSPRASNMPPKSCAQWWQTGRYSVVQVRKDSAVILIGCSPELSWLNATVSDAVSEPLCMSSTLGPAFFTYLEIGTPSTDRTIILRGGRQEHWAELLPRLRACGHRPQTRGKRFHAQGAHDDAHN